MNLVASTLATSGSPPPLRHASASAPRRCAARRRRRERLRAFGARRRRSDGAAAENRGRWSEAAVNAAAPPFAAARSACLSFPTTEGGQLEANVEEGHPRRRIELPANISVNSEVQLFLMSASRMWRSKRTPSIVISTGQITACRGRCGSSRDRSRRAEIIISSERSARRDGQRDDGVGRHERGDRDRQRQRGRAPATCGSSRPPPGPLRGSCSPRREDTLQPNDGQGESSRGGSAA